MAQLHGTRRTPNSPRKRDAKWRLLILASRSKIPEMNRSLILFTFAASFCIIPAGRTDPAAVPAAQHLEYVLLHAIDLTLKEFVTNKLGPNQLAVTMLDLRDRDHPIQASYRGDVPIYPASVIKLFYLAAAHRWMEDGKLQDSPELRRAMR